MKRLFTHLLCLAALLVAGKAQAADITVDAGGTCTLADAITSANTDTATGGCAAGSGEDTIHLQQDVLLTAKLPEITSTITIEGNGHKIDGQNNESVGSVLRVVSGGVLTLNEVTVTRGKADEDETWYGRYRRGGGIYNDGGTITLTNSAVDGNSIGNCSFSNPDSNDRYSGYGGGIYNDDGTVTLINSSVSGNMICWQAGEFGAGGGISNNGGTVALTNSSVSGNFAAWVGGGILNNDGMVTLTNSSVGGNIAGEGYGGGISNNGGTVALTNSTVSGNNAGGLWGLGGGIENIGTLTLTNSSVSGNQAERGGGIFNYDGPLKLINSTVSGNYAISHGGGISNDDGTVTLSNSTVSSNSVADYNSTNDGGGLTTLALALSRCIAPLSAATVPVSSTKSIAMTIPEKSLWTAITFSATAARAMPKRSLTSRPGAAMSLLPATAPSLPRWMPSSAP